MISLTQIQTFLEVAKLGSFSKASLRLSVPRSTVSARIQALEERLNVRLLVRTTRKVSLTHEGQSYFDKCFAAIETLVALESEFEDKQQLSGNLRLTAPIDISKTYLVTILDEFVKLHPLVNIEVIITDETIDMVENNIDIALRGGAPGTSGMIARRLGEGELGLYASPAYIESNDVIDLLDETVNHIVYDPTGIGRHILSNARASKSINTTNFELVKAMAVQALGIALLPKVICLKEVESGELLELDCNIVFPSLPIFIVMPSGKRIPERARALIDFLVLANQSTKVL